MIIMRQRLPLSRHPIIVDKHIDHFGLHRLGRYVETTRPDGSYGVIYELDAKFNFEQAKDREELTKRWHSFKADWRKWYNLLTKAIRASRYGSDDITLEGIRPWDYSDTARWMMVIRHHARMRFRRMLTEFSREEAA